jgi:hypothetical protein
MEKTIEQRIADVYEDRRVEEDGSHTVESIAAGDLATVIVELVNAVRADTVHETRLTLAELGFISSTPRDLMALRAEQQQLTSDQRQVQEIT